MMTDVPRLRQDLHLLVTDSGLGGLSICAQIERSLSRSRQYRRARLTYVNVWPDERFGYNQMPDIATRARRFDQALLALGAFRPDGIVIACNTLSVVYDLTVFSANPPIPVTGIIAAGVDLFDEALRATPGSSIVLLGTKTTIESGVHRERLVRKGIDPGRITTVACHGLAAAIEKDPEGVGVREMIRECVSMACDARPRGNPIYAGLCCTHYGYVRDEIRGGLERGLSTTVRLLDPGARLVGQVVPEGTIAAGHPRDTVASVEVVSKVALDDRKCRAIARLIDPVSPATARALLSYSRVPELF
jgi:glutamate racemase